MFFDVVFLLLFFFLFGVFFFLLEVLASPSFEAMFLSCFFDFFFLDEDLEAATSVFFLFPIFYQLKMLVNNKLTEN
jgi:hypothetical protein